MNAALSGRASSDISELSQVIGELRNFAAQQTATNSHMLEELKKIGERMTSFSEVGAGLAEYRKTLHERFGRIHEMMGEIDERCDKLEIAQAATDKILAGYQAQLKVVIGIAWVSGTIISSLLSNFGGSLIKVLAHASN
jgi:hypothetical protein